MGYFRNIFEAITSTQKADRSPEAGTPTGYEAYGAGGTLDYVGNSKRRELLEEMRGWVAACVSVISDEIASVNLHLYRTTSEGVEEVTDHPILDILYKVNQYTTKFDHFWLTQAYLELCGEAPWFLERSGKTIDNVYFLRPDKIRPLAGKSNLVEGYEYDIGDGKRLKLAVEDVLFLKYPNPAKPFRGIGTLEMAARTVDIDNVAEEWNKNFFENSARPDAVLTVKTDKLDKAQKDKLKASVKETYEGARNAHKVMVLFGDMAFTPAGFNMKDMDFKELQQMNRDKILGIFRVPKAIVSQTEGVNFASADVAQYVFARWTIKPKMERLIQQLNEFLLPLFPGSENMFLDYENPVPDDVTKKLERYQNGLANGWLTINEVRESEGLQDVEGGDEIYVPFGLKPLGQEPEPVEVPAEAPKEDGNAEANKDSEKDKEEKRITLKVKNKKVKKFPFSPDRMHELRARGKSYFKVEKMKQEIKTAVKEELRKQHDMKKSHVVKKKSEEAPKREPSAQAIVEHKEFWGEKNKIFHKYLPAVRGAMQEVFMAQRKAVMKKLRARKHYDALVKKGSDDLYNDIKLIEDTEIKRTLKLTIPIFEELFLEAGNKTYEMLRLADRMSLTTEIQRLIRANGRTFAKGVIEATNDQIRDEVVEALGKGETIGQITNRIKDVFTQAEEFRAERIARTETLRYNTSATEQAFVDSGVVEGKIWVTNPNPCEYCAEMAGKTTGLGEIMVEKGSAIGDRIFDYENLPGPPLHPNCECDLYPIMVPVKAQQQEATKKKI